ncbi:hypothetical protein QBZ16_002340 [Prototheca wickerhamii]|uniref:Magnesium-dependent phosphatase-1 n=1 Tax=Prototheca wickerhamii TaxID=3111 RepID=A0AAD9IMA9_PROWI|nr:hypothetical protein QBZ16_002340 [Prototheca wickerhamii]
MAPEGQELPKLIAFDLDATLWIPEMYELSGPPFKVDPKDGECLVDRRGEQIQLMGASRKILSELANDARWQDTQVAYVSRTEYPQWANSCLKLFRIGERSSMHKLAEVKEIYPGSKLTHFRRIHNQTGIEYGDMLFFDNESWNIKEVSRLGVVCVYTPDGMTDHVWQQGLADFAKAAGSRAA